ncbi:hypothetical protein FHS69_000001, partial [Erythrobacter flavus]|nr:hypothetical protein [Qipengyuania flava]
MAAFVTCYVLWERLNWGGKQTWLVFRELALQLEEAERFLHEPYRDSRLG